MKQINLNITPNDVVSFDTRIIVYFKAYYSILRNKQVVNVSGYHLCIILPCLLWNLTDYFHASPSGSHWYPSNTKKMFPELKYFLTENALNKIDDSIRLEWLLKTIESMLCESWGQND